LRPFRSPRIEANKLRYARFASASACCNTTADTSPSHARSGVRFDDFECELVEFNGEADHVHLLVNFPPEVAISRLVNSLEGRVLPQVAPGVPDPVRHFWRAQRLWSRFVLRRSVGGAPLSIVRQYIEQQNRPVQGTLARCADSRVRLHRRRERRRTSGLSVA
jgi:putative transposase